MKKNNWDLDALSSGIESFLTFAGIALIIYACSV
jgi:hypothetical protein